MKWRVEGLMAFVPDELAEYFPDVYDSKCPGGYRMVLPIDVRLDQLDVLSANEEVRGQ